MEENRKCNCDLTDTVTDLLTGDITADIDRLADEAASDYEINIESARQIARSDYACAYDNVSESSRKEIYDYLAGEIFCAIEELESRGLTYAQALVMTADIAADVVTSIARGDHIVGD